MSNHKINEFCHLFDANSRVLSKHATSSVKRCFLFFFVPNILSPVPKNWVLQKSSLFYHKKNVEAHGHLKGRYATKQFVGNGSFLQKSWISRSIILEPDPNGSMVILGWEFGGGYWYLVKWVLSIYSQSTLKIDRKTFKTWPEDVPTMDSWWGSNLSTTVPLKGTSTLIVRPFFACPWCCTAIGNSPWSSP